MDTRDKLQKLVSSEYVVDTLNLIQTVRDFCDSVENWTLHRETELKSIRDIKDQADKISLNINHVEHSENKVKAVGEYLWNGLTYFVKADSKCHKLEKKLGAVLKNTLEGLEKLDHFLDAVEKLTVTSLNVFTDQSVQPKGESPANMQSVITAARMASHLLLHFKRNNETFFLPDLNNVDVLAFQLEKYIRITQQLCRKMERKCKKDEPLEKLSLSETTTQERLNHLNQIRMDHHTRLAFIFQDDALNFIGLFSKRRSGMEQFLSDLEESAVQLDRMKKGASISTVAGSSLGMAGGVLSIVGLALAPLTAGVSLTLTVTGVVLGVTSGINSLVTGITETAVNIHHSKNARNIFQEFMNDTNKMQRCLEQVSVKRVKDLDVADISKAEKVLVRAGSVVKGIDAIVDVASAAVLKSEQVVATVTKVGLQKTQSTRTISKLTADLPNIGKLAKGTPLALTKSARAGFITVNALFIGLDFLFICKDSISLAKGSKSETSQLICSRATLWKSELEAWQKIYDSLCIGIWRFSESQKVLAQTFKREV